MDFSIFQCGKSFKIGFFSIFQCRKICELFAILITLRAINLNFLLVMSKEDSNEVFAPTIFERGIWKFYRWAVVFAPLFLMFSHWYIFYVFSRNSHELMNYSDANEICIAWIYSILYLYVPIMLLPASYFFRWCNLFRIPFIYFIFINVERWYYGSWFCTNEMIDTHYILIYCIVTIYVFEVMEIALKNISRIVDFGKMLLAYIYALIKSKIQKDKEEEE